MHRSLVLAGLVLLAGCASTEAPASSQGADLTNAGDADASAKLVATIRAAYEAACKTGSSQVFPGETNANASALSGDAAEAYAEYQQTLADGLQGGSDQTLKQATVDGQLVYLVSGDLSDTGWEFGFYDAQGNVLAVAYHGQGEHAGPGGIDWER